MSEEQFNEAAGDSQPGSIYLERPTKTIWIKCADGQWLGISKFRIEGKSDSYDGPNLAGSFKLKNFKCHFR